jgi:hypothetical protein
MELIEIEDARAAMPLEDEIPLEDLLRQHRLRYDVRTSQGAVRLKFIGALRRRTIELQIQAADPECMGKRRDLQSVMAMLKENPEDATLIAKRRELEAYIEPSIYDLFAGCFDAPVMRGGKSVMALADALRPEEWEGLRTLLLVLIAARPSGQVAGAMLQLCSRFGVKISDDLNLENMTAQQLAVLDDVTGSELEAIERAREGMR